jgi:ubiquinone biosynthesis protein
MPACDTGRCRLNGGEASIVLVTTAAGLRVHVVRLPRSLTDRGALLPLFTRDPERLPPPELEFDEPTPLEPHAERQPIIIDPPPPPSQYRVIWSFWQFAIYLGRWLRLKLTGRLDQETHAVMTRQLFERLSGMWIKVGQLLSLRSDLIPEPMARELGSLQYQARGFPPELARAVIEEDLGRSISSAFAWFETAPFAAASIAQVHRATLLRNNRAVVVKVMRPDVERSFTRDLRLLEAIVRVMGWCGLGKRLRMHEGIAEMRAILTEETNYQYEAVNLKRMRKNLKRHDVYVPRVIEHLSGKRVLVMEEVPGVLMSQYIRVRKQNPQRLHKWAVLNGIEDKQLARRLCTTVLRQILEDNEFHGDLHPGNIMLLTDNRIALIDFGSVGRLGQHSWTLYRYSMAALAARDYSRAADLMLMLSPSIALANNKRLRHDMTEALRTWELTSEFPSGSYADRSMAAMSDTVAKVMALHRVPLSWGIMRVGRSLSTLDASLQTLVPDATFMSLARAYFRDRQRRMDTWKGRRTALRSTMAQVGALASDAQLLLGTGIRDQALRLHGMLDRLTHVRIILLTFLSRGLLLAIFLLCDAFAFELFLSELPDSRHWRLLPDPIVHELTEALPKMDPLYWILAIGAGLYLFRLLRAVRNSIARLE